MDERLLGPLVWQPPIPSLALHAADLKPLAPTNARACRNKSSSPSWQTIGARSSTRSRTAVWSRSTRSGFKPRYVRQVRI
jgi:hypothetical protein